MDLIIEAGATKTDIVIFDESRILKSQINGINPSTNPGSEEALATINQGSLASVNNVYYYGAGVLDPSARDRIVKSIEKCMVNLDCLEIKSDLIAAGRSVFQNEKSIVAILGTGSNVGLFEGDRLIQKIPSPGFIFDDFGSGYHIGKLILRNYLFKKMSTADVDIFESTYASISSNLIEHLYTSDRINYTVAAFTKFLESASVKFKREILDESFGDFIANQLFMIDNNLEYNINFVGSIAFHFKQDLNRVFTKAGYRVNKIESSPLEGLIKYHRNKII